MPIRIRATRTAAKPAAAREAGALPFGLPRPPAGSPQKPPGISVCMIVKNEERFLEQCLQSVSGIADEINVVDTGSTDRTPEIAARFGAKVEHHAWRDDFAWARNKSLEMATRRWIFHLDADEELLPESLAALEQLKNAPAHLTGIWLRCVNASDRYRGGGTISHAIIRLFPNSERIRFSGKVHEFPSVDGSPLSMPAVVAPIKIVHRGYLGDVVKDRGKYERNIELIRKSVAEQPEDAFNWYNLGQTLHLNGEHEPAAEAFEKMWALCKQHGMRAFSANGLQMLADIYTEHLKRPEEGLEYALECVRRSPRYANAHFSAGKAYFALKRYDEARDMYGNAIGDGQFLDRQFVVDDEVPVWKAQCEIGSTFAEQGDHAKALEWFDKGLAARPKIEPLRINRAKSLEKLGRLGEAEAVLHDLYAEFCDETSTVDYVNFLLRNNKERQAVELIERHCEAFSAVAGTSMLLAAAYVSQRNAWNDGETYLRHARDIDPHNRAVLDALDMIERNRGLGGQALTVIQAAFGEKQYEKALAQAAAAHEALPGDGRFSYYAALACTHLQRKDEALRYLEIIPDDEMADNAWMLRAVLLRETGRNADALEAVKHVLERDGEHVDALLVRAALHDSLGDAAAAEEVLLSVLPLNKARASVELAALYLRTGRLNDARRIAEEALA